MIYSELSDDFSTPISEPTPDTPLSAEAERLLAGIPESIGDAGESASLPGAAQEVDDDDPIAALMAQVAFEEDDVRETLCEFCALLADKFDSEHWHLTERQARMWARPTAQLANSVWAKLQMILPDIFGKWCETMPGLFGFVTVGGIVMGPKLMKQVKLTRERRRSKPVIIGKPEQPQPAPQPEAPRAGGLIYKEGSV